MQQLPASWMPKQSENPLITAIKIKVPLTLRGLFLRALIPRSAFVPRLAMLSSPLQQALTHCASEEVPEASLLSPTEHILPRIF